MGTRHLIKVTSGGELRVASYCQWDGYPSGSGQRLAAFVDEASKVEALKAGLDNVIFVTPEQHRKIIEDELGHDCESMDFDEATLISKRYPGLSRDTGARLLDVIACSGDAEHKVPLRDARDFEGDDYCEWVYEVDLDANRLKVRRGGRKTGKSFAFGNAIAGVSAMRD